MFGFDGVNAEEFEWDDLVIMIESVNYREMRKVENISKTASDYLDYFW
jgi:hypothetical protein